MFKVKTLGVKTARSTSASTTPTYDFPALIMEQTPEEGSGKSSKFQFNESALQVLGITPEKEDDQVKHISFINGKDQGEEYAGRLFIAVAGNEIRLSKTGSRFASKPVHAFLNEEFDWIDTSNSEQVFHLSRIEHEDDFVVVEVEAARHEEPSTENTEAEEAITI